MNRSWKPQSGAVLIIVLGVLLVLVLLATTFATIQQVERVVSRNFLDDVRAKLIAVSGVEDGLQRMRQLLEQDAKGLNLPIWRFYGDDMAESGTAGLIQVDLENAKNPSFAYEEDGDFGENCALFPAGPVPGPIRFDATFAWERRRQIFNARRAVGPVNS